MEEKYDENDTNNSEKYMGELDIAYSTIETLGGMQLAYLNKFQGEKNVVLEAVKRNGLALQYASQELKGDRSVVLEAVKQNGLALQYVSPKLLQDDKEVNRAIEKEIGFDSFSYLSYIQEHIDELSIEQLKAICEENETKIQSNSEIIEQEKQKQRDNLIKKINEQMQKLRAQEKEIDELQEQKNHQQ